MRAFVNLILVSVGVPIIISRDEQEFLEDGRDGGDMKKNIGFEMKLKYCRVCQMFRPSKDISISLTDYNPQHDHVYFTP